MIISGLYLSVISSVLHACIVAQRGGECVGIWETGRGSAEEDVAARLPVGDEGGFEFAGVGEWLKFCLSQDSKISERSRCTLGGILTIHFAVARVMSRSSEQSGFVILGMRANLNQRIHAAL